MKISQFAMAVALAGCIGCIPTVFAQNSACAKIIFNKTNKVLIDPVSGVKIPAGDHASMASRYCSLPDGLKEFSTTVNGIAVEYHVVPNGGMTVIYSGNYKDAPQYKAPFGSSCGQGYGSTCTMTSCVCWPA